MITSPIFREGIGTIGDTAQVSVYAIDEYNNPNSLAYNDMRLSVQGSMFKWLIEDGPLEGAYLGAPGLLMGTMNTLLQVVEISTPFGKSGYKLVTEDDKKEAIKDFYEYINSGGYSSARERRRELLKNMTFQISFLIKYIMI